MPNTEAPKTPEQSKKPQTPSPETRLDKNKKTETALWREWRENFEKFQRKGDEITKEANDESNRWEEAWHKAHQERNKLTPTERRTDAGKKADKKIDQIRQGKIDGKKRKYSPEDVATASTEIITMEKIKTGKE